MIARSRALLLVLAVALTGLLAPQVADAANKKKKPKRAPAVTVMTRNLYLGADLGPAINAGSICEAIDAGGQILDEVDATDFPERSKLLAAEIAKAKPDLVGVQEAALWRFSEAADFTGSPATTVRYDFLQSLLDDLRAAGARYRVAVVQEEFDQELPADRDGSDLTVDAGLPLCGADEDGRLTMRDAILVRRGSKVKVSKPRMDHFDTLYEVNLGGTVPVRPARGWVSVEARVPKTKTTRAASFRFVNAHLEAFGDPAIREAQAREMFAKGGPLRTRGQLIAVGDYNTGGPKDRVGTGFTIAGDELAYNALVGDFGLTKLGRRQSCCFPGVAPAVYGPFVLDHTVDHVFAKPKVKQLRSSLTGADPTVLSPGGLVASDHAGVVATLRLKRR